MLRKITNLLSEALYKLPGADKRRKSGVIIAAAGSGTRMGNVAKQFMQIAGHPVVYYSLKAFEDSVNVDQIVVVVGENQICLMEDIVKEYGFKKVKAVVCGGTTRVQSVKNGFEKLDKDIKYVAIHDAARPLITTEKIDLVFRQAYKYRSSCAAGRIFDTVKKADDKGFIEKTVPRETLYAAQTPQIFDCDIYRTALAIHLRDGKEVTDDCSMVENAGFKIKLCDIEMPNPKLTVANDCEIIEELLRKRGKSDGVQN